MKKLILLFVFVVSSVFAQDVNKAGNDKYEKIFIYGLRSQNDGVVESMIFNLVLCGITSRREFVTDNVVKELDKLHFTGNSEKIKNMAGLASQFLSDIDPQLVLDVKFKYHDSDKMFRVISEALNESELKIAEH